MGWRPFETTGQAPLGLPPDLYSGYCEVPVLFVEFSSSNFACEGAVDVHKILMVCFQMKFDMFEHVFQVLKAVDNDL